MGLWWISFCDAKRPKGDQFLGVSLVETDDRTDRDTTRVAVAAAIRQAWRTGCNPGGQAQATCLPLDRLPNDHRVRLAKAPHHTLLSKQQLEELDLI